MGCTSKPKVRKQKASPAEVEQVRQARDAWQHYKTNYRPLEAAQIERMRSLRGEAKTTNTVSRAVTEARSALPSSAVQPGVRAGSGAHMARAVDMESIQGDAVGNAQAFAMQAQEDRYQAGMQRMIDYGLGKNASAASTGGQVASIQAGNAATNVAMRNYANRTNHSITSELLGTAVGAGMMYGANRGWGGGPADNNEYEKSWFGGKKVYQGPPIAGG